MIDCRDWISGPMQPMETQLERYNDRTLSVKDDTIVNSKCPHNDNNKQ